MAPAAGAAALDVQAALEVEHSQAAVGMSKVMAEQRRVRLEDAKVARQEEVQLARQEAERARAEVRRQEAEALAAAELERAQARLKAERIARGELPAIEFEGIDRNNVLTFTDFAALVRQREDGVHTDEGLRTRFDALDPLKRGLVDVKAYIIASLKATLAASAARVIDMFVLWDDDKDGSVTRAEVRTRPGTIP